ncbi:glycosyl hydrolase family 18 protein [Hahella sp. HN01]|uniref:glycosyl hydrolase family 18 protein n=1 Tax=Hahella sp. HN01 TaxID=2847262 RepID=UPI001C1EB0C2|nr:glycosyl hydrolase family 18 protein [Hahella sp. HN01]MBU6953331.1 carbohydrate-binding protein [Hahella sp. HN01]
MAIKLKHIVSAVALTTAMIAAPAMAEFKVVGYFPTWQGDVNSIPYDKVTHINYSFAIPTANGGLQPLEGGEQRLRTLVQRAHGAGVKVQIAVGGWNNGDDSAFAALSGNSGSRANFIRNLMNMVDAYGLDGVDLDWEYPEAGAEANNFKILMRELGAALHSRNKILTAAVTASDFPGSVDADVINSVDFLNLMVYDLGYPHSTYQHAQNALTHWKFNEGLPQHKAVLGVPFYSHKDWVAYKDVIARYGAGAAQRDDAGGLDYNGQPTIRAKTELALSEAGGVMFWEISQDTRDDTSLMKTIWETVDGGNPPTPGGITVQAENYSYMSGVQVEPTTDAGGGQNVGYIDANDWMSYAAVNIPQAGTYTVEYRVASLNGGGRLQLEKAGGSPVYGSVSIPATGAWQNWRTVQHKVNLPAGQLQFGIKALSGGWNINWFKVSKSN